MIALDALNSLPQEEFVATLAGIFEHSPWVAQRAAAARPFTSRLQLLDAMRAAVDGATSEEQLALIRAHPKLGARGRSRAALTEASAGEQHRAGLDACTTAEFAHLDEINAAYFEKFAVPFILAVRGHDPKSIIANCERRLRNAWPLEQQTAVHEIGLIAGYRLADLVAAPAAAQAAAMNERLARRAATTAARIATDASLDAGPIHSLVREWMLAAELEVSVDGRGTMIGRRRSGRVRARTLLIGVHYESNARALRYDGRAGLVTGIALTQQLKEKGIQLPFDLAVIARPADADMGDASSLAEPDALCGCVTLAQVGGCGDDGGAGWLATLRAAGFDEGSLAIVRRAAASIIHRAEAPLDAQLLGRAVRALEEFLLQNRQAFNHNGSSANHD